MRISDWSSDVCSSDLPGHPPLQVTDVLAHALQPAVEAAEVLQDQAFGFVCHSITITRLVTVAAMAGRGAFYRSASIPRSAYSASSACRGVSSSGFSAASAASAGLGRSEEHTSELQSLMRISY